MMGALSEDVGAAIAIEEAYARELFKTAKLFEGSPVADQLREMAREHSVHALELQARLAAVMAMFDKATRQ